MQKSMPFISALNHFGLGFVEIFVRIYDQTANGFAAANMSVHLGEESVLKLHVCVPFVAIHQHKVEYLTECGLR